MRSTILFTMAYFIRSHAYLYQLMMEILTSIILKQCKENPKKTHHAVGCDTRLA